MKSAHVNLVCTHSLIRPGTRRHSGARATDYTVMASVQLWQPGVIQVSELTATNEGLVASARERDDDIAQLRSEIAQLRATVGP